HVERIPEPRRHLDQVRAVGPAAEDLPALGLLDGRAVGADERVRSAEVLAHAEVDVAGGVEREAAESVVGIVALGVELDDRVALLLQLGLAVPAIDFPARREVEVAARM